MSQVNQQTCLTCLGGGEVSSERGMQTCPDCDGSGNVGDVYVRTEQQLRQVESRLARLTGETAADIAWLVTELRRSRQALLKVLTAAQDAHEVDELNARIRFEANDVLGIYRVEPRAPRGAS